MAKSLLRATIALGIFPFVLLGIALGLVTFRIVLGLKAATELITWALA